MHYVGCDVLVIEHFAAFDTPIKITTAIITALDNALALLPSICRRSNMSQIYDFLNSMPRNTQK
jgi:hypothetical protein